MTCIIIDNVTMLIENDNICDYVDYVNRERNVLYSYKAYLQYKKNNWNNGVKFTGCRQVGIIITFQMLNTTRITTGGPDFVYYYYFISPRNINYEEKKSDMTTSTNCTIVQIVNILIASKKQTIPSITSMDLDVGSPICDKLSRFLIWKNRKY